jgi:hypothetical protein
MNMNQREERENKDEVQEKKRISQSHIGGPTSTRVVAK